MTSYQAEARHVARYMMRTLFRGPMAEVYGIRPRSKYWQRRMRFYAIQEAKKWMSRRDEAQ